MESHIEHPGIVKKITEEGVEVLVETHSACVSCHARSSCSLPEMDEKLLTIPGQPAGRFQPGDKVEVVMRSSRGLQAVLIAYVLPVVFLVLLLIPGLLLDWPETALAFLMLGGIALYFMALRFFRRKLQKRFVFTLRKANT